MQDIDKGAGIIKTVIGSTDRVQFEDFIIHSSGKKEIGELCDCGQEELGSIIATQSMDDLLEGHTRLCVLKCHECDKVFHAEYK